MSQRHLELLAGENIGLASTTAASRDDHRAANPNTEIGELIHRGKYWYKNPNEVARQREVGLAVVQRMARFISGHPLLRDVDVVAAAPGHDRKVLSFGSRLAAAVARVRGIEFVSCNSVSQFRTPAKSMDLLARRVLIDNQFICTKAIDRLSVLIVDDVYSSGATAAETARALRVAGAANVAALCAVRTMRST